MTEIPGLVERVCRAVDAGLYGPKSDEDWAARWEFYTDPEHTRLGGPWYILQAVQSAIAAHEAALKDAGYAIVPVQPTTAVPAAYAAEPT